MKNQEVKNQNTNYSKALEVVMTRNNGTQAGISALQASLIRSQSLVK